MSKTCSQCEFFNLEGAYLFTTHRQNGKIYGQHVVHGSTCSSQGYEVSCKESGFICKDFLLSPDNDIVEVFSDLTKSILDNVTLEYMDEMTEGRMTKAIDSILAVKEQS